MRLWSLHPKYLDRQGLLAVWREALLAKAVLRGRTRGYRHHPQLDRFRAHAAPLSAMSVYLDALLTEAGVRGYAFDEAKVGPIRRCALIPVTSGQVAYEWRHLLGKLEIRSPDGYEKWCLIKTPQCHPLFRMCAGEIEPWERP